MHDIERQELHIAHNTPNNSSLINVNTLPFFRGCLSLSCPEVDASACLSLFSAISAHEYPSRQ